MKNLLRKAVVYLSNPHNRRALTWTVRRALLIGAAMLEAALREAFNDVLPATQGGK